MAVRYRAPLLIGRDDELRLIEGVLDAAREGHGGAVFVVGESGVGKSRLAAAVAELAYRDGMALLRGRGSAVGTSVPLRPMTEAVLSFVRSFPIDSAALGPYRPILGRLVPDWGQPQAEHYSSIILAEAVLRLTGLAGRDRGCLLVLDDLEDADAETLAVLEYLVDNLDVQPTVVLGTIIAGESPSWELVRAAARRDRCAIVHLDRLSLTQTRAMVGACLATPDDDIPPAVLDLIWASSGGNPYQIEELLAGLVDGAVLVGGPAGWRLTEERSAQLPIGFARQLTAGVGRLSPSARTLVWVAALIGPRFPLAVVQEATGMSDRDMFNHLQNEVTAQLVAPDDHATDWYAFRHRLGRESILAVLGAADRAELALTAAKAIETVYPGLPNEWCQISADLQIEAGNPGEAGALYAEAGRRALAEGNASSAVALLDRAWQLIDTTDTTAQAATLETLLLALAEAGLVERALASVRLLEQLGHLDPSRQVRLHTRLAWAAAVAGRHEDALAEVAAARRLLGPSADAADIAPVDVVAAHLALDVAGQDQLRHAEELARRAATVAESVPLPVVACQAWQLLGALARHRDLDEATQCLERARSIALRHRLPIWEIHALIRLGNDDALRDGSLRRLEYARQRATEVGAVTARYQAESSIAFHAILRSSYDEANSLITQVLTDARRLRLEETTTYVLLLRAVLAGHRGRRRDMEEALADLRDSSVPGSRPGFDEALHAPRIYGLARTFCALLEEDRDLARREMDRALAAEQRNPTVFHLAGRFGLNLLLDALAGSLDDSTLASMTSTPASQLRWDRQFATFARAVVLGRCGRPDEAAAAVSAALALGDPYGTARHLGLRLASESALADGWGTPVEWLRRAEEHFHRTNVPAVAGACRAMLRHAGARVSQRRSGVAEITPSLRAAGVTAREFEVLRLLAGRLSNKEIAQRLHLSPRTVERHISSLLQKTGLTNRLELGGLIAE